MDFNIKKGTRGHQTKIVNENDTAKQFESGLAEVYATPAMIALMEKTAFKSIEELLPEGFSTVGTSINIQHLKGSLPGAKITCESEVIGVEGKKISFKISAHDNFGQIGKAEHTRYIINHDNFMKKLQDENIS